MKALLSIIGFVLMAMAALATPIAIGLGLYDWVVNNLEFKIALWEGFKSWGLMITIGLGLGLPCYFMSLKK